MNLLSGSALLNVLWDSPQVDNYVILNNFLFACLKELCFM